MIVSRAPAAPAAWDGRHLKEIPLAMFAIRHAMPTDEEMFEWSGANPGYRIEYVNGAITIVSPTTLLSGLRSSALLSKFWMQYDVSFRRSVGVA